MGSSEYDLIIVGGGLGGAALGKAMAEHGRHVLVLEREKRFKDRVRGEIMTPWGVAEARELGLYEPIRAACGTDVRFVDMGFGPRDLIATTPQRLPALAFYHPEMQETVLAAAAASGAEVRRGASVSGIEPGPEPSVLLEQDGWRDDASARLIVAADGRGSGARKWAGFAVQAKPKPFLFAGLLLEEMSMPNDAAFLFFNPDVALLTGITPTGKGRFRVYVGYESRTDNRLQGDENVCRFIEESKRAAPVATFYFGARPSGPLASFPCGDFWVDHPYKHGIALIGDAAGTSDQLLGRGCRSLCEMRRSCGTSYSQMQIGELPLGPMPKSTIATMQSSTRLPAG